MRRENLQVDRLAVDALVVAGNSRGLVLDLTLHVAKINELPVGNMVELGPLVPKSLVRVLVADMHGILGLLLGDVDQLQDKWSSRHNATTAG